MGLSCGGWGAAGCVQGGQGRSAQPQSVCAWLAAQDLTLGTFRPCHLPLPSLAACVCTPKKACGKAPDQNIRGSPVVYRGSYLLWPPEWWAEEAPTNLALISQPARPDLLRLGAQRSPSLGLPSSFRGDSLHRPGVEPSHRLSSYRPVGTCVRTRGTDASWGSWVSGVRPREATSKHLLCLFSARHPPRTFLGHSY